MRSALAEVALRGAIGADWAQVSSAGTAAIVDNPADPRAVAYARRAGLDLDAHRASLFDARLGGAASLIFALDRRIEAEVVALDPALASRTLLLAGVSESGRYLGADVDDPYLLNDGATARSFDLVLESVRVLAGVLRSIPRS
jgi:protein-tyrosine phosphatase